MSRAFVKEGDGEVALPERAVSPHPNLVTASGLAQIDAEVRALEASRRAARQAARGGEAGHDAAALAAIERDLRYWVSRKASARLVTPAAAPDIVRFGVAVTLRDATGATRV
ncbi:MAG: transcription elongation factor, partial [Steroidobacteraceae bacterium]|nr:transcription elongation factor [Steroidobacteraceae bacterium]